MFDSYHLEEDVLVELEVLKLFIKLRIPVAVRGRNDCRHWVSEADPPRLGREQSLHRAFQNLILSVGTLVKYNSASRSNF